MEPVTVGIAGIILMAVLLFLNVPLFISMGVPAIIGMLIIVGPGPAITMMVQYMTSFCASYTLSVIPIFILMGYLAFGGGISDELYDFAYKWVGRAPGGLAVASIVACGLFGAVTGSAVAGTVAIGSAGLPEMKKRGYDDGLATATMASGGTLGHLIPPSITAVIYAAIVRISVGRQLMAGLIPGIVSIIVFSIMIMIRCRLKPELGPPATDVRWGDSLRSAWKVFPPLVVFLTMFGGMFAGFFTPTEAASVGVAAVLVISLARRRVSWNRLKEAMWSTILVTGQISAILIGAALLAQFMALSRLPFAVAQFIAGLELPTMAILVIILLPYIPLGMVMDEITMILITMPVIFPVVQMYGINPTWFGVLMVKLAAIALVTPPVGISLYAVQAIAKDVKFETIMRGIVWFVIAELVTLALLVAFPQLSLWIPGMM